MLNFLPRRLLQLVPTLFLVSVLIFGLQQLLPGDPALVMAGEEKDPAVIEQIRRSGADILFIGMPSPFKEVFAEQHRDDFNVPVIMGVGGSFDVLAGVIRRAPQSWQRVGMEWSWRLLMEPRKLWRRYLVTNTLFIARVARDTVKSRF